MGNQLVPQDKILDILATHREICATAGRTLHKAIKLGRLLSEVRETIPHGEWLPWIENNITEVGDRMVRNYLQLWENRELIWGKTKLETCFQFEELPSIREALALIRKPKAPSKIPGARPSVKEHRRSKLIDAETGKTLNEVLPPTEPDALSTPETDEIASLPSNAPGEALTNAVEPTGDYCPTCGRSYMAPNPQKI